MSGSTAACLVTLSQPAATNTTVSLTSTSTMVTVPTGVTVPANSSTAGFSASAGLIRTDASAVITGTLDASSRTATLTLWSTPVLSAFSCAPLTLAVGSSSNCTLTLSKPAGPINVSVTSGTTALAVPGNVTVQQGSMQATFTISAQEKAGGWLVVTAALNGVSKINLFRITNANSAPKTSSETRLQSVSCAPRKLSVKEAAICTIKLNHVTETDAADVQLSSSSESIKVPAIVNTRPGQSSLEFQIDALAPAANDEEIVITASLGEDVVRETVKFHSGRRPALNAPGHQIVKFGDDLRFSVSAEDPAVSVSAESLPAGATFDNATGTFYWTPYAAETGTYRLGFRAIDAAGRSDVAVVKVDVDAGEPLVTRIVNAASRMAETACSSGAIASIEGRWLGQDPAISDRSRDFHESRRHIRPGEWYSCADSVLFPAPG